MKQTGKKFVLSTKNKYFILAIFFLTSCQYFRQDVVKTPIAQVDNTILYFEDVSKSVYKQKSPEDSTKSMRDYIENWAYQTLLVHQAKNNVDTLRINRLVDAYKRDLLIDTYKDLLAEKYLDTVVNTQELQNAYEKNKSLFTASNNMINISYLVFPKNAKYRYQYKKWFFSDKIAFRDSLIKNTIHFTKLSINDDNWMEISEFKQNFPVFKRIYERQILKKSKKFVLTDSLSLYLLLVNNVVKENEPLPLKFIENDLKQLIISKRKQKVISKLQNEIKTEAVKQKKFKIFKIKKHEG